MQRFQYKGETSSLETNYCTACLGNDIYCFDKGLTGESLTTARTNSPDLKINSHC